jgi:hypothetical protein
MRDRAPFAHALLDAHAPIPQGLRARRGASLDARFAVYRNNVVSGLIDALQDSFPATLRIVGADFFRAMAQVFVRSAPPRSPVLRDFAQGFPAFLDSFPPAQDIVYLADVARIEAARIEAFHAADADHDADAWARAMSGDLNSARIALHPSARLVRSRHPIVTIWRMNASDGDVARIENWTAEHALVYRDAHDAIHVETASEGAATLLASLQGGATLGAAAQQAISAAGDFDLTGAILLLMRTHAKILGQTGAQTP